MKNHTMAFARMRLTRTRTRTSSQLRYLWRSGIVGEQGEQHLGTSELGFVGRGSGAGGDKLRDRLPHLRAEIPQSRCFEVTGNLPGEPDYTL